MYRWEGIDNTRDILIIVRNTGQSDLLCNVAQYVILEVFIWKR